MSSSDHSGSARATSRSKPAERREARDAERAASPMRSLPRPRSEGSTQTFHGGHSSPRHNAYSHLTIGDGCALDSLYIIELFAGKD